MSQQEVFEQTS